MAALTDSSLSTSPSHVFFLRDLHSSFGSNNCPRSSNLKFQQLPQFFHIRCFSQPTYPLRSRSPSYLPTAKRNSDEAFFSNVEDTDEALDELFEKHGRVVFQSKDSRSVESVDDDSESLSFAVMMAKAASDVKAAEIKVLFVKPLVYWTRFFIIATAFSNPQIDAICSRMKEVAEGKGKKVISGDAKPNSWTLLDFGDVVVHIFLPPQRAFYNLEEFYGNATAVELPFENRGI